MTSKTKHRRESSDDRMDNELRNPPPEILDSNEEKAEKINKLVQFFKERKKIVVITGAGISTAASIPDYRGVNGLYTKDIEFVDRNMDMRAIPPTKSHMILKEFIRLGYVSHLISQNCDGLHLRSGIPQKYLSEVHGNMYIESCKWCDRQYIRPYDVSFDSNYKQHETTRKCLDCRTYLDDTIVHAGEKSRAIWPHNWQSAVDYVNDSEIVLIMGTSGVVLKSYTNLLPEHVTKILINTQSTMIDDKVSWKIGAKCDEVLSAIFEKLELETDLSYCSNCDLVLNQPGRTQMKKMMHEFTICQCHEQRPTENFVLDPKTATIGYPGWLKNGLKRMRKMYIYPEEKDEEELTDNDDSYSPGKMKRSTRQPPPTVKKAAPKAKKSVLSKKNKKSTEPKTKQKPEPEAKPAPKKRGRKRKVEVVDSDTDDDSDSNSDSDDEDQDHPSPSSKPTVPMKRAKYVRRSCRSRSRSVDVEVSSLADDHEEIIGIQDQICDDDDDDEEEEELTDQEVPTGSSISQVVESPRPTQQPVDFGRVLAKRDGRRERTPPPPYYGPEENNPAQGENNQTLRNLLLAVNDLEEAGLLPTNVQDLLNPSAEVPEHMNLSINSLRRRIAEDHENGTDNNNIYYEQNLEENRIAAMRRIDEEQARQLQLSEYLQENDPRHQQPNRENFLLRIDAPTREVAVPQQNRQEPHQTLDPQLVQNQPDVVSHQPHDQDSPTSRFIEEEPNANVTTPPGFLNELDEPEDPTPIEAPPPMPEPAPQPQQGEQSEVVTETMTSEAIPITVSVVKSPSHEAIVENPQKIVVQNPLQDQVIEQSQISVVQSSLQRGIVETFPISVVQNPLHDQIIEQSQISTVQVPTRDENVGNPQQVPEQTKETDENKERKRNPPGWEPIETPRMEYDPEPVYQEHQLAPQPQSNYSYQVDTSGTYRELQNVRNYGVMEQEFDENFLEMDPEDEVEQEQAPGLAPTPAPVQIVDPRYVDLNPMPDDILEPDYYDEINQPSTSNASIDQFNQPSTSYASNDNSNQPSSSYTPLDHSDTPSSSNSPMDQSNQPGSSYVPNVPTNSPNYYNQPPLYNNMSAGPSMSCHQAAQIESRYLRVEYQQQVFQEGPVQQQEMPVFQLPPNPSPPPPPEQQFYVPRVAQKKRVRPSRGKKSSSVLRLENFPIIPVEERESRYQWNFDTIMGIVANSIAAVLNITPDEYALFQAMFIERFGRSTGRLQVDEIRRMLLSFKADHCGK